MDVKDDSQPKEVLIDALPYIDQERDIDPKMRKAVDDLVAEEMNRSSKPAEEYLKERNLSVPDFKFLTSDFAKAELDRISRGEKMADFKVERYSVEPPPPEQRGNLDAWIKAVQNAQAQLEMQTERLINLELMKKYGANAWKAYNEQLVQMKQGLSNAIAQQRSQSEQVNRKRKADQMTAKPTLENLEFQFYELANKNNDIETVCWALERELKRLKTIVGERDEGPQGSTDQPAAAGANGNGMQTGSR